MRTLDGVFVVICRNEEFDFLKARRFNKPDAYSPTLTKPDWRGAEGKRRGTRSRRRACIVT